MSRIRRAIGKVPSFQFTHPVVVVAPPVPIVDDEVPTVPMLVLGVVLVNVIPLPDTKLLSGWNVPKGDVLSVDIRVVTLLLNVDVREAKSFAKVESTLLVAALIELNACVKKSLNVCVWVVPTFPAPVIVVVPAPVVPVPVVIVPIVPVPVVPLPTVPVVFPTLLSMFVTEFSWF